MSGYSALAVYSMLNPRTVYCFAAGSVAVWENVSSRKLQSSDEQYEVELWRYDPKKLTEGECVDKLSLSLALQEDRDERVEQAVDEILVQVWGLRRDKEGKL